MTARRVHRALKMRKLIWEGETAVVRELYQCATRKEDIRLAVKAERMMVGGDEGTVCRQPEDNDCKDELSDAQEEHNVECHGCVVGSTMLCLLLMHPQRMSVECEIIEGLVVLVV